MTSRAPGCGRDWKSTHTQITPTLASSTVGRDADPMFFLVQTWDGLLRRRYLVGTGEAFGKA